MKVSGQVHTVSTVLQRKDCVVLDKRRVNHRAKLDAVVGRKEKNL
jgi:hypothetical protein